LDDTQWASALALAMPFSELNTIYTEIPPIAFDMYTLLQDYPTPATGPIYSWPGEIENVGIGLGTIVPNYECPSDNINDVSYSGNWSYCAFVPRWDGVTVNDVDWAGYIVRFSDGTDLAKTNYVSCIGAHSHPLTPDRAKWKGCMTTRARVTLESISDGSSRTIMMGENIGPIWVNERGRGLDDDTPNNTEIGYGWSWFWGGTCVVRGDIPYLQARLTLPINGYGPLDPEPVIPATVRMLGNTRFSPRTGFGATHPAGVNIGLADGSIHTLNRDLNWQTLYELGGAADGGTPTDY
jgi:hypothetical protein